MGVDVAKFATDCGEFCDKNRAEVSKYFGFLQSCNMTKRVIIIGNHPISKDLVRQYEGKGYSVVVQPSLSPEGIGIDDFDELCLLAGENEDNKALALLGRLAEEYDVNRHEGLRMRCHLLLHDGETMQQLQTCDLSDEVRQKMDVYPFTIEEVWARGITFDYEPITLQSTRHVHLVLFGFGELAECVAIHAARVAHYPNYVRNHTMRTRITFIEPQAEKKCERFIQRYQPLFDNSYYRVVKPSEEVAVTKLHRPMYEGKREDFVDVEWEFVEADIWNATVREKLELWAKDPQQLLTVVLADPDGDKNTAQALFLPNELHLRNVPVHCYKGLDSGGSYDVTLPLVRMAKNVNYIYDRCYEENVLNGNGYLRFAIEADPEERERSWAKLSAVRRMSSIYNAMTIPSKMRSVGLDEKDWDKFYDIPQQDIELLAQVEHNRWSVETLISGYRPCTDAEQKIIAADVGTQKGTFKARKIHYDLRAYHDLKPDGTGKSVQVYDVCLSSCLPWIAKEFADEKGGRE